MNRPSRKPPATAPTSVRKKFRLEQLEKMAWGVTHMPHRREMKIIIYQRESKRGREFSFDQRAWDRDATKAYTKARTVIPATPEQVKAFNSIAKQVGKRQAEAQAQKPAVCPKCCEPAITAGLCRAGEICPDCKFKEVNS